MAKISFHDATIREIHTLDQAISIVVDQASVESLKSAVRIELRDVTSIDRDGVSIDSLRMEKEDGEVLSLSTTSTGIELVVEWHDFYTTRIRDDRVQSAVSRVLCNAVPLRSAMVAMGTR